MAYGMKILFYGFFLRFTPDLVWKLISSVDIGAKPNLMRLGLEMFGHVLLFSGGLSVLNSMYANPRLLKVR